MPIKDLKKWLSAECPQEEIRYVNTESKKGAFIPIGIIEQNLDEFDNWWTTDFSYVMMKVDRSWVASGTVCLHVKHGELVISRHGASTFTISSKSDNEDFEATALSLSIANAAKKLGKRFGRHLNGRLDIGEKTPTIDLEELRKLDAAIDEINETKTELELKKVFDNYPQYQKTREFIVATSNKKQLIKISSAKEKHNG